MAIEEFSWSKASSDLKRAVPTLCAILEKCICAKTSLVREFPRC